MSRLLFRLGEAVAGPTGHDEQDVSVFDGVDIDLGGVAPRGDELVRTIPPRRRQLTRRWVEMAQLLQIGISYPHELKSSIGHVACTLGGVNYESRGGDGIVRGSVARGATHALFNHRFYIRLTDQQPKRARSYADKCVGRSYVWGGVPLPAKGGGDCSGYVSGIICAAFGKNPLRRLFGTGTWLSRFKDLGFARGLGGGAVRSVGISAIGRADRPYPGFPIAENSPKHDDVKWIQSRLNFAGGHKHAVICGQSLDEDGVFGPVTLKVVKDFQSKRGLQGLGQVGPKTWKLLNALG